MALCFLGWKFRGFAAPEAMDQAQVGSELAAGHGWSTRLLRPLAIWQVDKNSGPIQRGIFPDTFNAPLPPLLDAVAIKLAGNHMEFKRAEYIAPAERFIVALSMLCFLGAVVVQYFLIRRVFDVRLAFWSTLLTLACDLCWRFTLSGLPQMFMLLLFNAALYTLVRAIEAQLAVDRSGELLNAETGETAPVRRPETVFGWLMATGACFGLLALTHALTIWLFVGALVFAAFYFRQRAVCVLALLFMFSLFYAPWLIRNYEVCGNAFGVAGYSVYDGVGGSTATRMRSPNGAMTDGIELYFFRTKIADGIVNQIGSLLHNLGDNILALGFFVCLLHVFRRREVNALRWAVLLMWLAAVFGMALLGNSDMAAPVGANQIGILFLPIMLGFGLAFVLVLFSRREGEAGATARIVLFTVLFLISLAAPDLRSAAAQRAARAVPAVPRTGHQQARSLDPLGRDHRLGHALGRGLVRRPAERVDSQQVPGFHGPERLCPAARPAGGVVSDHVQPQRAVLHEHLPGRLSGLAAADLWPDGHPEFPVQGRHEPAGRPELYVLQRQQTLGTPRRRARRTLSLALFANPGQYGSPLPDLARRRPRFHACRP